MLVALKLADHADDDGSHIYPSIKYIAAKTRQSPRAVQYQLRRMQQSGFLILVAHAGGGRGKAREYRISREWINGAELAPIDKRSKDAEIARNAKGAIPALKGATHALKGATDDAKGRNSFAPESSGTVIEPSLNHQGARRAPRVALHSDILNFELPETIPFAVWDMWCEHREAKSKDVPWTRPAATISIKRLLKLDAEGQSPEVTVEEAVLRGWTGLFPVKAQPASSTAGHVVAADWWKTSTGITERGKQLSIEKRPEETDMKFKARVFKAAGPGEWMEEMLRSVKGSESLYEHLYAYFNDIPREKALAEAA